MKQLYFHSAMNAEKSTVMCWTDMHNCVCAFVFPKAGRSTGAGVAIRLVWSNIVISQIPVSQILCCEDHAFWNETV
jgi:hypothetical protein